MVEKTLFGIMRDGCSVYAYTMKNKNGASVKILDYGGTVVSICVPDRDGKLADVVCGYDSLTDYCVSDGYQGALVGRYANRIGNASFELDGVEYHLAQNDGKNHLHGGNVGFDKKIWSVSELECENGDRLALTYVSADGEENYPGTLTVTVTYTFTDDNALSIHYEAVTDKKTVANFTNHSYFNLGGYNSGRLIHDHLLWIDADAITLTDNGLIPTGELLNVSGTPFDFRTEKAIGKEIDADYAPLRVGQGYDHNFVLNGDGNVKHVVTLTDPVSGRVLKCYTDQPCVQIYTGNCIDETGRPFKGGVPQKKRMAVCLETQHAPDAMHHPEFAKVTLDVEEKYNRTTVFAFAAK